ncbi:MAG TPA: DNA polymerase III subunit delta' [Burkholderiaceae bacterium]|nr:DNA polymerase III subunit delta' [Burkholderiaceae bacterium]
MTGLAPWLDAALGRALALPAHAVLIHGPGALGQFELALDLASAWLCESPLASGRACGRCTSCHLMAAHSHPDFRCLVPEALAPALGWADPAAEDDDKEAKKKPSREIKVEAVRAAIDWGQRTSARAKAKAILIHPAEAMNLVTANALLKTLEEPPGTLRLVLNAHDPEALLPTVRSRCQRLPIAPPARADALAWLAGQGVAAPDVLLGAADGLPPAALALVADGIDAALWQRVPGLVRQGLAGPLAGLPVPRVVEMLGKLCHDLMAVAADAPPRYFDATALAPALKPAAPPMARLADWSRALLQAARHDDHPWNAPLRIEALLAQAAALWQTAREQASGPGKPLATLPAR